MDNEKNCNGCANLKHEVALRTRGELELWDGVNRIANAAQNVGLDVAVIRSRANQFVAFQVLFLVFQFSLLFLVACK